MHPPIMRQFLGPLNRVAERMSWVHLMCPILINSNETGEIRTLTMPVNHEGTFEPNGWTNPPHIPFSSVTSWDALLT